MTIVELEQRLLALEQAVLRLQAVPQKPKQRWWTETAGRFADDPVFDEIVRLGREYRESQREEADAGDHS